MGKLIGVNMESNPENDNAVAWFAYFEGSPSEEDLMGAFRSVYKSCSPEDACYEPKRFDKPFSSFERWFLCQAV